MAFIFDGEYFAEDCVSIHPGNRGLRYGEGVFETMRWQEDHVLFFSFHLERLKKGLAFLEMDDPADWPALLPEYIQRLCTEPGARASARVRLNVFRGEGKSFDTASAPVHYLLEVAGAPESSRPASTGLSVGVYTEAQRGMGPLANLKSNNYLASLLGARYAHARGWDDALLLNAFGRVTESTIANLFVVNDQTLYTPPLSEGCVAGVIRRHLLECLPGHGFRIEEAALLWEDVQKADEIFLTNAIRGVRPVARLGDVHYGSALTAKVAAVLAETAR